MSMNYTKRAILHIDGDAFFASCEQSRNPALKGKPVVTGKERGIAASMSYEAKNMGVSRAMRLFEIQRICPDAIILPSDYETYSMLSKRFFGVVRRFTDEVEEYSIDECFADITGYDAVWNKSYVQIAKEIQDALTKELGFTFSIGLGPNKVVAKIGSKWKKPYGLTIIPKDRIDLHLASLPVEKLWGIGPQTTAYLNGRGIIRALDFKNKDKEWVSHHLSKPFFEIWQELNGEYILPLELDKKESYQSIQKIKTFTPPSSDKKFVFSQLSKNIENACMKARRYHLATREVNIFLRTQDFHHEWRKVALPRYTSFPHEIIRACEEPFSRLFFSSYKYRATGITLNNLQKDPFAQRDIFSEYLKTEKLTDLYNNIDAIRSKYGKYTIFLGSSFHATTDTQHKSDRGDIPARTKNLFKGETERKRLNIPMFLGEIK